ncbi:MAG: helix-turn-helix domain-containing protein [Muribaculaceae bacterium]|nr:helix-turn-helix domain-containing protein [Muribaculaceae bacterium]
MGNNKNSEIRNFYADSLAILEILEKLNDGIKPTLLGKRFYTDAQLAERLNISRRTLQEYRDNGLIAFYRLDGKILYADDDVETFLKSTYRPKY